MSTSRRTILGLLAGIPAAVALPNNAQPAPSYHGILGRALDLKGGFLMSPEQADAFRRMMEMPVTRMGAVTIPMRGPSPWDAPNRLYGAAINDEGDAI
jgi:hypothetical protein